MHYISYLTRSFYLIRLSGLDYLYQVSHLSFLYGWRCPLVGEIPIQLGILWSGSANPIGKNDEMIKRVDIEWGLQKK